METHPRKRVPRMTADGPSGRRGPHLWEIQAVLDVLVILSVVLAVWMLYALSSVFTPVLFALGLAYLCNPLVTWMEHRWHVPRPVSISLVLLLLAVSTVAFLAWLGPLLIQQAQTLMRKAPQYLQMIGGYIGLDLDEMVEALLGPKSSNDPMSAMQPIVTGTGQALGLLGAVIGTTSYLAVTSLLLPIYFFFFAWRFEAITLTLRRLIPVAHRPRTVEILAKIDDAVMNFFRGRLLIALITGVLYAVGWAWTGVPYWFLLGAGTGLLSIIPYVNAIGWPLAIIFTYLDATANSGSMDWISLLVFPSLPYLVVQFFESWWLTPWIQGRSNDLHPVTVIIVVMVGGAVGGILGLTLAIPIAASLKILLQELVLPRWKAWVSRD
ncbi:MAG TPA: AI-2E family transporter [Nitrospira sp.]|nr:AI-2E family transporter [Nitrospira sp.]